MFYAPPKSRLTFPASAPTVGDRLWLFDINSRVYPTDDAGRRTGQSPQPAGYFRPMFIVGEARQSWLLGYDQEPGPGDRRTKVAKAALLAEHSGYYTDAQRDEAVWAMEHQQRLLDALRTAPVARLQQVAALIGLEPLTEDARS